MLASPYNQYDVLRLDTAELHRTPAGDCSILADVDGQLFESETFRLDGGKVELAEMLAKTSFRYHALSKTGQVIADGPESVVSFSASREDLVLIVKGAELDGRRRLYRCFIEASGNSALWVSGTAAVGTAANQLYCASVPAISFACIAFLIVRNWYERGFMHSMINSVFPGRH